MHIIAADQHSSMIPHLKSNESARMDEECEFDHRQYRYLLSIFADNVNQMLKLSKDCLTEMEYQPKYRVSKQQQDMYEPFLAEIYQKYKSKLSKESVYRNTIIKKSCDFYLTEYDKVHPRSNEIILTSKKSNIPSATFLKKFSINDKKSHPLSIKSQRKTTSNSSAQEKLLLLSQTFKAFQTELSATLKLKTISSDNTEAKEYFLRTERSHISRNDRIRLKSDHYLLSKRRNSFSERTNEAQNCEDTNFRGNEILISDNHRNIRKEHEWQHQKQVPFHNKFCTKRVVAIGQPQKKIINDIELLHLQTKNLQTSSVFYAPTDLSSYKPKGKKWFNIFS